MLFMHQYIRINNLYIITHLQRIHKKLYFKYILLIILYFTQVIYWKLVYIVVSTLT